ncbi:MAG: Lrp/AsnC family transcriptional regulator [Candidatus Woesearchaeota archaeon]|nr:Lrp/AsnC family transcriptional regulator [Candidatus Woesearchaeota archaeon]
MAKLDEKDCKILSLLQENCRMSLTEISHKISLSVDSTKKRIIRLMKDGIFFPKVQLRPRHFGFSNVVEVKIKLHDYTENEFRAFIEYLKSNPYVVEIITTSGQWNLSIVIIARDALDLGVKSDEIRKKFSRIINEWSESLTTAVYKFESYDMSKLVQNEEKIKKRK